MNETTKVPIAPLLRPQDKDTICALASASGSAGISVLRVSGPSALLICGRICTFLPQNPESHRIYYGHLSDPSTKDVIDEVLVSYFSHGRSFTGEETLEISTHGNPVLVSEVLRVLIESGARPAERGEFSYRAFMNGRIDLVQAEGILELVESQTKRAAQLSLRQLEGQLSSKILKIKNSVTAVLAHLEANIDFAAEDIEIESLNSLRTQLGATRAELQTLIAGHQSGRIIRSGYQVVLVGKPNVGKSSLLNALLEQDRSIVTAVPGTTRDLIEGTLLLGGYKVDVTDTAGLRESEDEIEKIGQERAQKKILGSDLVLLVLDASGSLDSGDLELLESLPLPKTAVIWNKSDLNDRPPILPQKLAHLTSLLVSAKASQNLDSVRDLILEKIEQETPAEETIVLLNSRHYRHLTISEKLLGDSMTLMVNEQSPDLIALDLHGALREIYLVLGEIYDDQVMDTVFNQFCIGK